MQIRVATDVDTDKLFDLAGRLSLGLGGPLDRQVFTEQMVAAFTDDRSVVLVADLAGSLVGYALGLVAPMPINNGTIAFLQELYVDDARRRSGQGRALVEAFTEWGRHRGATTVCLATSRAGDFYEALGFTTHGAKWYRRAVLGT